MTATRGLFAWMVREEWRLHADLFGGRRFALFPGFVAAVAAGSYVAVGLAGTDTGTVVAGLHALVLVFGLHVGTVGLVGRDALENLLGDVTLLVFAARTLPVSDTRLLAAFLAKDACYYSLLFVTPLVAALAVPALVLPAPGLLAAIPLLWLSVSATFVLGLTASLALVGLYTRSRVAVLVAAGAVGLGAWAVGTGRLADGADLAALTPYGVYAGPRPLAAAATTVVAVAMLAAVGLGLFRFDRRTPARTARDRFDRLAGRLPADGDGLVTKSLLDVARSSGGVWKVVVSQGLVFGVVAAVLANVTALVGLRPSPGITFGALLALGSFTTYNWLAQFDDATFYRRQPVTVAAVLRAKFVAYLLLALPTAAAFLLAAAWWFGAADLPLGVAALAGLSVYLFGVTVYLTGLEPNSLLFDTAVFAAFSLAVGAAVVPVLVAAFAYPTAPGAVTLVVAVASPVAGLAGYGLYRGAGPRWERRLRA